MDKLDKEAILNRLFVVDEELKEILDKEEKIDLIIIGASAFLLKDYISRTTTDIDVFKIKQENAKKLLVEYDINDFGGSVMTFCDDFEERLEKINMDLDKINLYILSDYDLVISKLGSKTRPKDWYDLINSDIIYKIDFDELERILKENLCACIDEEYLWNDFNRLKGIASKKE